MISAQQPIDIFQYSQCHGSVIVITLDFQFRAGPVNYGSRAKPRKAPTGHHACSFTRCLWMLLHCKGRDEQWGQRPYNLQILKYLLSDHLSREFRTTSTKQVFNRPSPQLRISFGNQHLSLVHVIYLFYRSMTRLIEEMKTKISTLRALQYNKEVKMRAGHHLRC